MQVRQHSEEQQCGAHRAAVLARLRQAAQDRADVLVIGGGATGLGIAVDAAQRGLRTVLLEAQDFAQGTSSRATKLLHGGVRYLQRGDVTLVREALRERETVIRNAPQVAQPLAFVVPAATRWQRLKYAAGLSVYQWLAGRRSLGRTRSLSAAAAEEQYAALQPHCMQYGAVRYWDAQFDDARLALELALKARELGAVVANHCAVTALLLEDGKVAGVQACDAVLGEEYALRAGCVINATGVWADNLRWQADRACAEAGEAVSAAMVQPSQGAHVVLPRRFWPHAEALLVPQTSDGRVLFAVPWLGAVVVGTTDTPVDTPADVSAQAFAQSMATEPVPLAAEVDFILQEAGHYLRQHPTRGDVLSAWAGLRPLVRAQRDGGSPGSTAAISREHTVELAASGLVTVVGGKWTTYRSMAEDALQQCMAAGLLPQQTPACATAALVLDTMPSEEWLEQPQAGQVSAQAQTPLSGTAHDTAHDTTEYSAEFSVKYSAHYGYGRRYAEVLRLPGANHWLLPAESTDDGCALSEAMVRHAVRFEMACTVEDVLARRRRLLFLHAEKAQAVAAQVGSIMQQEGIAQPAVAAFLRLAAACALSPS